MEEIFELIKTAYQSLWKIKNHGNTIELITPMVTTNDMFVSVFITRRGDEYIVTDGGWLKAGMYECEIDLQTKVYSRVFDYYYKNFGILETSYNQRTFYYKKICQMELLPNLVFDMSNFISSVVSSASIQYYADKVEKTFKKRAQQFLIRTFEDGTFEFDRPISEDLGIRFNAISHFDGQLQLINFVSGSSSNYYANALCRSKTNLDMIRPLREQLHVNKTITLVDDSQKNVMQSPQVITYLRYMYDQQEPDNHVIMWKGANQIREVI